MLLLRACCQPSLWSGIGFVTSVGCMAGSHSSYSNLHTKIYDHHCPLHISNYLQYLVMDLQYLVMARPSHGIAKIGSVKVISFLESIETPESVRCML